jgi:hypothetical protein
MRLSDSNFMSHTHARVHESKEPSKPGLWIYVVVGEAILFLVAWIALPPWWTRTIGNSSETATGHVLETRIATFGTRETYHGGRILYRIEALVRYDLHGKSQDRWMGASEVTSDRDLLALRLVKHPDSCDVYWAPHHPENPNCLLK